MIFNGSDVEIHKIGPAYIVVFVKHMYLIKGHFI